jgi:hypothetical protein
MSFDPEHEPRVAAQLEPYGDIRDLLRQMPAGPYDPDWAGTYVLDEGIFPVKHRLLRELDEQAPVRSVVEIGAYFGAFPVTALAACPNLRWLHLADNESYTERSNDMLRENLLWFSDQEPGRSINWSLHESSVQMLELVDLRPDLVHVDGDHSFAGCFFDLVLAWAMKPREIWIDDYFAIDNVRRAVEAFSGIVELAPIRHETTNGLAVFQLRKETEARG